MGDPAILLADEPTGNLDSTTGKAIEQLLDDLNNECRTIIMVTHDDAMAGPPRRVVRLHDGKIADDAPARPMTSA